LLDARSEAQAVHGLEMRTELRFGVAADELRRQLSELPDQMLILGVSALEQLSRDFQSLLVPPGSCSLMIVYRPTDAERKSTDATIAGEATPGATRAAS
jgi:hypothetical protein